MIKVENLKKNFGALQVLDGISFELEKGKVLAVVGPSGTGKSTLLRCLNYLEKPSEGKNNDREYISGFKKRFKSRRFIV